MTALIVPSPLAFGEDSQNSRNLIRRQRGHNCSCPFPAPYPLPGPDTFVRGQDNRREIRDS